MRRAAARPAECAGAVEQVLEEVFAAVAPIGAAYRECWARAASGLIGPADVESLRELILDRLAAHPVLGGCGVVMDPAVTVDGQRRLQWWARPILGRGAPSPLRLDLDPASEDSYDYVAMPWYSVPRTEGRRVVVGPYLDLRGAGQYVFTFADPVGRDGVFLGVAGADVAVQNIEPALLGALAPLGEDAVLVGQDRRVVTANSARWPVGARLKSFPEIGAGFRDVVAVTSDLGWVLAVADH